MVRKKSTIHAISKGWLNRMAAWPEDTNMTTTLDFVICPNCGKRYERTAGAYPDFCPDCGEDMKVRLGRGFSSGGFDFDCERRDIMDFYEREDWE
jgi:predicted RNA-binding Zn-ribbon protein involved in translation (DUF1610 family)